MEKLSKWMVWVPYGQDKATIKRKN
jgi:hypothetical protein